MSYQLLKVGHLFGVFLVIFALGGICLHSLEGGKPQFAAKKIVMITHGIGMILSLLCGFAMLYSYSWSSTLILSWGAFKLFLWLALGLAGALALRQKSWAQSLWYLIPAIGFVGAFWALFKPF